MSTKDEIAVQAKNASHPCGTQIWFTNLEDGNTWFRSPHKLEKTIASVTSTTPNDPLNWPAWRRDALLIAIGFSSFLSAALCPILATGFPEISDAFGVSTQKASFTIGIYMLGLGVGTLLWSPTATLFGRRPVYVAGSLLLIASCGWAAASPSYASLVLARFVQGLASSPGEFLVSVTISEVYQPQERGFRLGIYMLLLAAGKSLSPLIGAGVIQRLGWRWVMWVSAIASGVCFGSILIFGRETYWVRDDRKEDCGSVTRTPGQVYTDNLSTSPPLRFSQALSLWNGRLNQSSWFTLAYKPMRLLRSLTLLWSATIYALSLGWLAVLAETISHLFQSVDGYGFRPLQTGLLYISPLIGTVLGSVVGGKVSDILAWRKAHHNHGIYEPESRLVMMIPAALTAVLGLAGYGVGIEARTHWVIPTVCFGAVYFGCILCSMIVVTYSLDVHKVAAIEAQVILSVFKNVHGLAFSLFVVDWVKTAGPRDMFLVIAGIHLVFLLTTTPMFMYGKRIRMRLEK